jgi:GGDEF domain-containing protein
VKLAADRQVLASSTRALRALLTLLASLYTLLLQPVFAAPQIAWTDLKAPAAQASLPAQEIELRGRWESVVLRGVTQTNLVALDPQVIAAMGSEQFAKSSADAQWKLASGDRLIARFQLLSEKNGNDLVLTIKKPRLDAVHLAYRHDGGEWVQFSAGDTVPMQRWAVPDIVPSFAIPQRPGQTDVIVQVAHRGNLSTEFLLQNESAHRVDLSLRNITMGLLMGVQLVLGMVAVMIALHLRQRSVLAVSAMAVAMIAVLVTNSGLIGLIVPAESDWLSDELKFLALNVWCVLLPWVAAGVLDIRRRVPKLWVLVNLYSLTWIFVSFWMMDYEQRDQSMLYVPLMAGSSLLLTLLVAALSYLRRAHRPWALFAGVGLYMLSMVTPYFGFLGLVNSNWSGSMAAVLSTLGSLFVLVGLYNTYRLGRQVVVRAQTATTRDPLTGLANRAGFETHLRELDARVSREPHCALLCYVSMADTNSAVREVGFEGFEMGMVQLAATLCTGIKGIEEFGRVSPQAIAMTALMRPDPAKAVRLAQSVLTRSMVLAAHGTELANSVRIGLCWLPLYGMKLDGLEQRLRDTMSKLDANKRIAWVGGQESSLEMEQYIARERTAYSTPPEFSVALDHRVQAVVGVSTAQPLTERIRSLEREVFDNVDTQFLIAEAERLSHQLNATQPEDEKSQLPSELEVTRQQIKQNQK